MRPAMSRVVEVLNESESPTGWVFVVQFIDDEGALHAVRLALSWQDYDLYCPDGSVAPETVAKAVACVAWDLWPEGLPARMDAAALRRRDHGADALVTQRVDLSAM